LALSLAIVPLVSAGPFSRLRGDARPDGINDSPVRQLVRVETTMLMGPTAAVEAVTAAPEAPVTPEPQPPAAGPESEAYIIGIGDTLMFQCFDDPALSREQVTVLYDGTISLPLIEDINVEGLSRHEAENRVRDAYEAVFRDPQVSLSVRLAGSKNYYVMGDVANPERFFYDGPINVLQAINRAGGLRITQRSGGEAYAATQGSLSKAFIIRSTQQAREVIELDLKYLTHKGPHPSEAPVYPGDIVYVPEGVNLVYILGEVRSPSVFQLGEKQTLSQVLAQAGGPSESTAKIGDIIVMRPVTETESDVLLVDYRKVLKTGVDFPITPGDVIYVPRKDIVRLQEFVSRLTGSISPVLSLYSQFFDAYYAEERNRLLVETADDNPSLQNTLQTIRGFGGSFQGVLPALQQLPVLQGNP
jgi:protein involved in polysaccharide export with SLBB domain